jgi:hypothetical protein
MRRIDESMQLVTVFTTGDKAAIALAKSLLEGSGIKYTVKNDLIQDLFTWGRLGIGFNPLMGPVRIMVSPSDVDMATELLGDLAQSRKTSPLSLRIFAVIMLLPIVILLGVVIVKAIIALIR